MPRYRLTIAYDGTDFHGWQRQEPKDAPALRTVQGVVEEAVAELIGVRVDVVGASRTDSGVHAIGQVAAFTADVRVPVARLAQAITARLPRDVQVIFAEETHRSFSPIGDAKSKCYRYTIEHTSHPHHPRPLFDRNFVFATPYVLDASAMQKAAAGMIGTYDCASFAQIDHGRTTTVRTVHDCVVRTPRGSDGARRVEIEISASGFLYNMVRIMAGTLLEVGRGRIAAESMQSVKDACDRRRAGPTLPPQGLCLRWIWYGAPAARITATEVEEARCDAMSDAMSDAARSDGASDGASES